MKRVNFETEKEAKAIVMREVAIDGKIKEETDKAVKLHVELAENLDNLKKSFDENSLKEYYRVIVRDTELWVPKSALLEKNEKTYEKQERFGRIRNVPVLTGRKITVIADWFLQKNSLHITDVK